MLLKLNKFFSLIFSLASFSCSEQSLEVKDEYKQVVGEIIEILDRNHFKKNIDINDQKVMDNFLKFR